MLKHLLSFFLLGIASGSFAQNKERPWLSVGGNVNFLVGETSHYFHTGYGGNLRVGVPFKKSITFTLTSGYTFYKGKMFPTGSVLSESVVPIRLGVQFKDASQWYFEPQLGYSRIIFGKITSRPRPFNMFGYSLNAGYIINQKIDLSAYYESNFKFHQPSMLYNIGIRAAYKFHF